MTDDEVTRLRAELAAKLREITALTRTATELHLRLNELEAEQGREPATIHELHPR